MGSRKDSKGRVLRKGEFQRASNGKYVYGYTDKNGKRHYITSKDLGKLRQLEEEINKQIANGVDAYLAATATVNDMFERYISTKSELRSSTRTNYAYMYDRFLRDNFGMKKIGEVKYSDVLLLYSDLLHNKGVQINTLETIHTILHPTFQMAVRDEVIARNPTDGVMAELKKKSGKNKGVRHALTLEQQRAFLNYVAQSPVYSDWNVLFTVLFGTGCRVGEAVGLRWEDVDLDNRTIKIDHQMTYYPRVENSYKCEFKKSEPKTDSGKRTIPMMDRVYEVLSEEYARQTEEGFSDVVVDGTSGFIFTNRFGTIHNPQALNRAIERIRTAYNAEEQVKAARERRDPVIIPHFSCHHIRHTFCSRLCENGVNIKVIQSVMGHADIETTMDIYAEVTEKTKKEALNKMSENMDMF